MSFKVIETDSSIKTKDMIQRYTSKGFIVVSNKKNSKGGSTLTFKSDPKKKSPLDGIRLAAWIVGLVELVGCATAIIAMILLIVQGVLFQNNQICQQLIEEMIKQGAKNPPSIIDLNNIGRGFIIAGSIVAGLSAIALIPTIWSTSKVRKTTNTSQLCAFAVIGIVSLCALPTAILMLIVRSKIKALGKQSK